MKDKQRILFIALNRHQRNYFQSLGDSLSDTYKVFYDHYPLSGIMSIMDMQSSFTRNVSQTEINEIIAAEYIRGKYHDFGPVRQLFFTKAFLEKEAYFAINYYHKYITEHDIDLVCVWNGTGTPLASATHVSRKLGKKTMYFENGLLPNTTTVDPKGVNNRNSLVGQPRSFYEKVTIDEQKLAEIYHTPLATRALKAKWYKRLIKKNPPVIAEDVTLPRRFIFMPLQVHDDSQVLLHSPRFKTMREFIDYVVPAVQRYNEQTGDDLWVVIKEHPSDFGRVDYTDIKEKYQGNKVIFVRAYPTPQLIKSAEGIITLNSSVGLESLVNHKPVITLGSSFYNVPGVVTHIGDEEELSSAINIINQPVNDELIDKFLYYLRYHYLVTGNWRDPNEEHFSSAKEKIETLLKSQ